MFGYANPQKFWSLSGRLLPWLSGLTALLIGVGLAGGLILAPPDYQQGEAARIMFVHVPAAWMAMFTYLGLAGASLVSLVWRHSLADVAARAMAPAGAVFTALALITGAVWGQPMWGTWWVWDARLTSVLVLFFLYLGYMALWAAIDDQTKASKAAAILALVGAVNVPIIKFSVDWWNSLHQPASVFTADGPKIDSSMLWPLLVMALGYTVFASVVILIRMRTEILERKAEAAQRRATRAAAGPARAVFTPGEAAPSEATS